MSNYTQFKGDSLKVDTVMVTGDLKNQVNYDNTLLGHMFSHSVFGLHVHERFVASYCFHRAVTGISQSLP